MDDFALRRGHTHGTILIDITTSQPVDMLPERSAEVLAAWLKRHPRVEIVCRDRADCYADGATRGARGDSSRRALAHVAQPRQCCRAHRYQAPRPPTRPHTCHPAARRSHIGSGHYAVSGRA
ncbi:transposase [Rhizohabitans arisaemae]|uniref:transposase n=1 Tax=Rhizohabitans arisaemae TaxID=2720610 RepID=UPI003D1607A3